MTNNCCTCRRNCMVLALIVSGLIGVVAAFLRITGVITVPTAVLAGAFVLAAVYLATLLVVSSLLRAQFENGCLCPAVQGILAGILVTALTAITLLAVPFAATSVVGALVTGVLAAGASLIFAGTACLVKCLTDCNG